MDSNGFVKMVKNIKKNLNSFKKNFTKIEKYVHYSLTNK